MGVSDPAVSATANMLLIGANFPNRYQNVIATRQFGTITLKKYQFLTINYKGDGHAGGPLTAHISAGQR